MSSDISFSNCSSVKTTHHQARPHRMQASRHSASFRGRFAPAPLSEAGMTFRANLAEKTLLIRNSELGDFVDDLISFLHPVENSEEISELKKIKNLFISRNGLRLNTIIKEHEANIKENEVNLSQGIRESIKDININTISLLSVNEKNPIIRALRSLDLEEIDELKSKTSVPKSLNNFFKKLKFYATFYQAERALNHGGHVSTSKKTFKNLIYIAGNLLKYEENEFALKVIKLTINLLYISKMDAQEIVTVLRPIASILFLLEEREEGLEILEKTRNLIQDVSSIEDQLEDLEGLAIDYFILGEEDEVIEIIHFITHASYFSIDDRASSLEIIFRSMLDEDGMDFLLDVIEHTDSSLEKDLALKALITSLLEDVENEDAPSQALQLAERIQDQQLRAEMLSLIPEDQAFDGEIEA